MKRNQANARIGKALVNCRWSSVAQLTLVEHSLCPLDPPEGGFRHEPEYFYFKDGKKHSTTAYIDCPLGLHPKDERSLSRLVALALSGDEPQQTLSLGVRYLLRYLQISIGGSNRKQVRETIRRLGNVNYRNENFFDPVRKEYREVSFKFFSYSIPKDDESYRPWSIAFDPVFFEFCRVWGGFLGFQHQRYRKLRPATGRLFLWLKKLLYKNKTVTPYYDVEHLCVNVLGFAPGMDAFEYTKKIRKCALELADAGIIELPDGGVKALCEKKAGTTGKYRIRFHRGPKTDEVVDDSAESLENPAIEMLTRIGLDEHAIRRTIKAFDINFINEGADITLARMERKMGFTRSPMAFFVDYVTKRAAGKTTPPDWYHDMKKQEGREEFIAGMRKLGITELPKNVGWDSWQADWKEYLETDEGRGQCEQLARDVFGGDARAALGELQKRFLRERKEGKGPTPIGSLFKNL